MLPVLDSTGDPERLTHDEQLTLLESIEAERAALDALQQRTLAALARTDTSAKHWTTDEVAAVLHLSPRTTPGLLHDAHALIERLPHTLDLLTDATLTLRHARVLIEASHALDDATLAAVETRVLRRAAGKTVSEFRQAVRRAVAALDPRTLEDQHADAVQQRRVVPTPQDNGTTELWALLATDDAARIMNQLNHHAATTRGLDDRTADQRRADALVDLITTNHSSGGSGPPASGSGPRIQVTVALTTLLDLDDQPADLDGHGPIPATMARRLAADPTSTWHRILTDLHGELISISPAYRPPAALRDHVTARDRTCRFPGCRRPAQRCELDHRTPFSHGGTTCEHNLHALCARHHHLKHEAGWRVRLLPNGDTEWQTPTGHTIHTEPEPYETEPVDPP